MSHQSQVTLSIGLMTFGLSFPGKSERKVISHKSGPTTYLIHDL